VGYEGSEQFLSKGFFHTADPVRLIMGAVNAQRAWQEMGGHVDWVYERLAALQFLGWILSGMGCRVLETNAIFSMRLKLSVKAW